MLRLRYLFLTLVTLGFAGGIVASLVHNQRSAEMNTARIQLSAWSLAQLEFEYLRFYDTLRLYRAGAADAGRLRMSFDLLWSRLDVFLTGDENRAIRQRFGGENTAKALLAQLQADEPLIFAPDLKPDAGLDAAIARYAAFQAPIRDLMIHNFTGPDAAHIADEINRHHYLTQVFLLGLLFCGGALALMLFYEARRNHHMARNDVLTQLPNRFHFKTLQKSLSHRHCCALAVIELSNFRAVNENISHDAGDLLLTRVGEILNSLKPEGSFIARVDGDEFVMTFPDGFSEELVKSTLNSLAIALCFDFQNDKHLFQVGTRIGLCFNPDRAFDLQKLYQFATLAVREQRLSKRNGLALFTEEINNRYLRSQSLLSDLKRALAPGSRAGNDLLLHYQPIVACHGGQTGVEVLLRWLHPQLGYISPLEVVELAENNQMGPDLGRWVLQRLKRDLLNIPPSVRNALFYSVNIAPSQFTRELPEQLRAWLAETPIRAEQLQVEMTESISVANFVDGSLILRRLNQLGIQVALDDFGTGYSSLSYLKELNIQRVKIDKSFIQGIGRNAQQQQVVRSIIDLCHTFHFKVVCEGIEDELDAQQVSSLGSDFAQGYWYGKPMPMQALLVWLTVAQEAATPSYPRHAPVEVQSVPPVE